MATSSGLFNWPALNPSVRLLINTGYNRTQDQARVSRAHVLPAGTVPLVPGGTVPEYEGDVEDRQMAGQKNRQKGLQTMSQTSSETKCCRFSLEH